jgi:hypothetical protein
MEALHWICVILAFAFGTLVGAIYRDYDWYRRISLKSQAKHRTADCVDGVFYYYIPEGEFVKQYIRKDRLNDYLKGRPHAYDSTVGIVFMDEPSTLGRAG